MQYKDSEESWKNYYMQVIIDLDQIRQAMKRQIRADLTIGKLDNDLNPFTEEQILEFLEYNSAYIENAVLDMYEAYRNDGELEDLRNAELDWYREFLYNHIDI